MSQDDPADPPSDISLPATGAGYTGLVRYTLTGFGIALLLGLTLDRLQLQDNGFGHWAVRVLAGQGESLCEGLFAVRQRLRGLAPSIAEAYGWGKVTGMIVPWVVDAASGLLGVDTSGVAGFYIPFLYGMADQIGANVGGFLFIWRRTNGLLPAIRQYLAEPVMLASLMVIPLGAILPLTGRLLGFRPDTQLFAALETAVANLSWLPPVVGWLLERQARTALRTRDLT